MPTEPLVTGLCWREKPPLAPLLADPFKAASLRREGACPLVCRPRAALLPLAANAAAERDLPRHLQAYRA